MSHEFINQNDKSSDDALEMADNNASDQDTAELLESDHPGDITSSVIVEQYDAEESLNDDSTDSQQCGCNLCDCDIECSGQISEPLIGTDFQEDQPKESSNDSEPAYDEFGNEIGDYESEGQEDKCFQPDLPWSHGLNEEFSESDYPRPTMESVIEAILFASDEPLTDSKLMNVAQISSTKQVKDCIDSLNVRYKEINSAFKIEKIAGGYQMMTHKIYNNWLMNFIRVRAESKLSQAALETLAIIAYKQPVIKADLEAIRGVSSGEMIKSLIVKGLVKVAGRAEILGRPMLYATTRKFLEVFGMNSLRDLPKAEELKKPKE